MKYLENVALEKISNFLSSRQMGDRILGGRIETFSCKRAGDEKKLSKALEAKIVEGLSNMTPPTRLRSSSLGDLTSGSTRRLLIDLISTLNASFPDYDFSSITSESFVQEDSKSAIQRVNSYLAEITTDDPDFLELLWRTADDSMHLSKCEVFSYLPDLDEENPFNEGTLWSFNYFFFNKELKRICYFNCNAKRCISSNTTMSDGDDDDEDMDIETNRYDNEEESDDDENGASQEW